VTAMQGLFRALMADKLKIPEPADCLPGRDTPMRVPELHYVTKNQMVGPYPEGMEVAVFANGCFWGTEKAFWRLPGVFTTAVGYCGGTTPNPTYEETCSGRTGHTEAVQVVFDPKKVAYTDLLRLYWQSHDPTQYMAQGNDVGTQYRSGIYPVSDTQHKLAAASWKAYDAALKQSGKSEGICSEIKDNVKFYYAEDYHQQYLAKPGARPYCSAQPTGVPLPPFAEWKPEDVGDDYAPKLPEAYWAKHAPRPGCTINFPNGQVQEGDW